MILVGVPKVGIGKRMKIAAIVGVFRLVGFAIESLIGATLKTDFASDV